MEIYKVGGAVRDELLGNAPKDIDFVVVGATPQQMLNLGYTQVGADFPVFLHPESKAEYALARTERKSGRGYNGFEVHAAPDVTLEEDLGRRDLTINSMAMDEKGKVVDPFKGQQDLRNKVLRHSTEAFREDPLRLLRVARFLARFGEAWSVAPETLAMLKEMVQSGEVDYLTPERVWVEFSKGLSERYPVLMLDLLHQLSVFERAPFVEYQYNPSSPLHAFLKDRALKCWEGVPQRFALAFNRKWAASEAKSSRIPSTVREVTHLLYTALAAEANKGYCLRNAEERLTLIESFDAVRQDVRFYDMWEVFTQVHPVSASQLIADVRKLKTFSSAEAIGDCTDGREIARRVRAAKVALL